MANIVYREARAWFKKTKQKNKTNQEQYPCGGFKVRIFLLRDESQRNL